VVFKNIMLISHIFHPNYTASTAHRNHFDLTAQTVLEVKVKVKLSLCLTNYAMKAYGTSALVGGEWSASCPCRFTPGKEPPVPM
jgi:hypothetical protein